MSRPPKPIGAERHRYARGASFRVVPFAWRRGTSCAPHHYPLNRLRAVVGHVAGEQVAHGHFTIV